MIHTAVIRAEGDLIQKKVLAATARKGVMGVWTKADNGGQFAYSPHVELARFMRKCDFEGPAAVLGGGLGGTGAIIELFVPRVDVYEADRDINDAAARLWKGEGDPYDKINFFNEDFTGGSVDIAGYRFMYFFHPFVDDFARIMAQTLKKASSGAMIVCHDFYRADKDICDAIFPTRFFDHVITSTRSHLPFEAFKRT